MRARVCQCNIHVWMLTGDKLETAISIGMSTKLLSPEANMMIVQEHDGELLGKQLQRLIEYGPQARPPSPGRAP